MFSAGEIFLIYGLESAGTCHDRRKQCHALGRHIFDIETRGRNFRRIKQCIPAPCIDTLGGQLHTHLVAFMAAYKLKTLSGLISYEYIAKTWTPEPERFIVNPIHQMPGLNT